MTLDVCTLCYLKHVPVSGGAAFRLPVSLHRLLEEDPATNREKREERGDVRCVHRRIIIQPED